MSEFSKVQLTGLTDPDGEPVAVTGITSLDEDTKVSIYLPRLSHFIYLFRFYRLIYLVSSLSPALPCRED